jgi:mono/diheme cytochrome c family protein
LTVSTPEGKVKSVVKDLLRKAGAYQFWPVQSGYGTFTVDCIGCHKGEFFAIETKAPGKKASERQQATLADIAMSGAKTFVISGDYKELEQWLSRPTA